MTMSPEPRRPTLSSNMRHSRVNNACAECKRRKIRCDGLNPCYTCRLYKRPERCSYAPPEVRPSLTRKSFDALRLRLEDATNVLRRLFPTSPLEELTPLTRDGLINLLSLPSGVHGQAAAVNTGASPQSVHTRRGSKSPDTFEYDESVDDREGTEAVADDVNSLSLRPDRTSSYVGPSSAMAGLRVLLNMAPKSVFSSENSLTGLELSSPNANAGNAKRRLGSAPAGPRDPRSLVDAYFVRIHPITPILDESVFRTTFSSGERTDSAWLALLNMVLALGVIACTTSDSFEDVAYYNAAKSFIGIESFGSGHIETLQALTLMAGWYLHYRNRPNMASAVMGAVFRMANALGLHKELAISDGRHNRKQRELRRRIWWSLVVLDVGEATNLGRVSNSNLFTSEVNLPSNINDDTGELVNGPSLYSTLIADVEFSKQASHIQERLISSPQLEFTETLTLDAHLVYWYENLPSYFRSPNPCPDWLVQPRASSKWRYQNLRIILHRPAIMEAALRHLEFQDLCQEQRVCVNKCQTLARSSIEMIASEWTPNQYSGWPASWYLFQACIIPLLSLYTFKEYSQQAEDWNLQVQKAIHLFKELEPWDNTARRQHELISLLYNAHNNNLKLTTSHSTTAPLMKAPSAAESLYSEQLLQNRNWSEMPLWGSLFNFEDLDVNFLEPGSNVNGWNLDLQGFD